MNTDHFHKHRGSRWAAASAGLALALGGSNCGMVVAAAGEDAVELAGPRELPAAAVGQLKRIASSLSVARIQWNMTEAGEDRPRTWPQR